MLNTNQSVNQFKWFVSGHYIYYIHVYNIYSREKDDEIKSLTEQNKQQSAQAEKSLADFKSQVEKNQTRMYDEMKQQVNVVIVNIKQQIKKV